MSFLARGLMSNNLILLKIIQQHIFEIKTYRFQLAGFRQRLSCLRLEYLVAAAAVSTFLAAT